MSSAKLWKTKIPRIAQSLLIFILVISWIFLGWLQIFGFPPGIQVVQATASTPTIAGTGANVDGAGTEPWATTDEITVAGGGDDGVYATQQNGNLAKSEISDVLAATNFGFTIPDGSTILGITVEVDRREGNTQANGGIIDNTVQLIDETGAIRTTVNKADTTTFWPTTDGTVSYGGTSDTWGEAAGFWTTAKINDIDFGVAFVAENKKAGGGGAVEEALVDFIRITVEYGPPAITVGTIGTQTASMNIPSTSQYVGGAFTMVRSGGSANVTSITITENGTVDALNNLDNIKLQYDLDTVTPYDCASESYASGDTQYGSTDTDGFSAANGTSAFTGSVAVSDTQAMCVYVVLDVGSGASDAETLEIEITDPSADVVVSAGDVTPATAVAISGATTLNLPLNVFQDHFRWRNDDGPQGNQSQTLYFNPTGNGFAQNFSIVAGCSGGSEWDCVDDGSADTESSAPTSDLETSELLLANGKSYYTLADDVLLSGSTITQLDITVAGADDVGQPDTSVTLGYCITCDGNNDFMGSAQAINGADQTKTEQFTGLSLSTTDLNNLQLVVQGSGVKAQISTVYVLVTYSVPEATWAQNEDIAHTNLSKNTNIRLRFQIDNTGGSASAYNYRLEWAEQSGTCDTAYSGESYVAVPDVASGGEHFDMTLSDAPGYVDGDPTTAKLSNGESYSFIAGDQVESTSNQSNAITLAQNEYTEVEYVFQANANATDSGVYCFRVTNAGTELDGADVVAQVTLSSGGAAPTLSNNTLDRATLTLNENTFVWASSSVLVTDTNGCSDISSVSAKLYLASTTNTGTTCAYNGNNCYTASCVATTTGNQCSADNDVEYDCGFQVWYTAEATDASAPTWASSIWSVSATATDAALTTGTATNTTQTVEVGTLNALALSGNIAYPQTNPDANTGATNQTVTVTNTGNTAIDAEISGDVMCTTDYPTCSENAFGPEQQKFGSSDVTYASLANLLSATSSPSTIQINLAKPTSTTTPVTINLFWGIAIPNGKPAGTYTGQNIFTAILNI